MRSEHKTRGDEWDAFTGWRKVLHWQRGELKKIKRISHKLDRQQWKKNLNEDS